MCMSHREVNSFLWVLCLDESQTLINPQVSKNKSYSDLSDGDQAPITHIPQVNITNSLILHKIIQVQASAPVQAESADSR